ncbi:MAG: BON domain-containing protein [Acidobacteria bacterium]|nr:BON domain-containing protein [Acidobacteriota bacterium]MYK87697.1 BON domain-containing protein [Acidobacteriota bacterium]
MNAPTRGSLATILAVAGLFTLGSLEVHAGTGAAQSRPTVADAVAEMLRDGLDLEDVTVTVDDTEATLAGSVPTLWDKTEAINRTLAFPQVETVASELVVPEVEDDNEIAREVGRAIINYRYITIWDYVGGGVEDGVVTLNGAVTPDRDKPAELFERVARIPGVQEVRMQVAQQSASARDDRLRMEIASRALRHPTLSHYTLTGDIIPPFRIIVDQAVVMLVGSVRSGAESRILESIARQAFESEEVRNLLQYPGR